jgi:hypothetical protein
LATRSLIRGTGEDSASRLDLDKLSTDLFGDDRPMDRNQALDARVIFRGAGWMA